MSLINLIGKHGGGSSSYPTVLCNLMAMRKLRGAFLSFTLHLSQGLVPVRKDELSLALFCKVLLVKQN